MAIGGNLIVNVGTNLAGLTKGLGKAGGLVSGFGSKLNSMAGITAGIAGVAAPLIAAGKGAFEIARAFGDIDRIAKSADAFGITTEQMVGLEHAANLSGVSAEALAKAMQRATRQGLTLEGIADEFVKIEGATERAKFAYKTLGKQGQDLIPLLAGGGDAIREMMAEGARMGGFTRESAAQVEAANDAISRTQLAFTGLARSMAITFAPVVEDVAAGITGFVDHWRASFDEISDIVRFSIANAGALFELAMIDWQVMTSRNLAPIAGMFMATWNGIAAGFTAFVTNIKGGFLEMGNLAQAFGAAVVASFSAIFEGRNPLTAFADEFVETLANQQNVVSGGNPLNAFADAFRTTMDNVSEGLPGITDGLLSQREAILNGIAQREAEAAVKAASRTPAKGIIGDIADDTGGSSKGPGALTGAGAFQRNSAQAFSAIFGAMRGGTGDAAKDTANNTAETVAKMDQLLRETRRGNRADGIEIVTATA